MGARSNIRVMQTANNNYDPRNHFGTRVAQQYIDAKNFEAEQKKVNKENKK